jgi:hypothetical protein
MAGVLEPPDGQELDDRLALGQDVVPTGAAAATAQIDPTADGMPLLETVMEVKLLRRVMAAEELARRRAICLACEDWDAKLLGCKQIHERERTRLTAYKQEHGHCARYCNGGLMKW